jgi:hypothetical protein
VTAGLQLHHAYSVTNFPIPQALCIHREAAKHATPLSLRASRATSALGWLGVMAIVVMGLGAALLIVVGMF